MVLKLSFIKKNDICKGIKDVLDSTVIYMRTMIKTKVFFILQPWLIHL